MRTAITAATVGAVVLGLAYMTKVLREWWGWRE